MRRGALRACALLLRSRGGAVSAASEPTALLAAGPLPSAVGGPAAERQLWAPWPQAPLHSAAPAGRQTADSGSSESGSDSDSNVQFVKRAVGPGQPLRVRPQLAAELRLLAAAAGVADTAELSRRVAALGPRREQGVVEHGPAVAKWLLSLGVPRPQLANLLHRCPLLFSRPVNERAAVLFGQLAQLGLTAAEAARCFEQTPTAANVRSFQPAIAVLVALFAAGSKAGGGSSGEQLLGDLLRQQPAAVGLLVLQPSLLQERVSNLVERYGPHWVAENKAAVIVTLLRHNSWSLLARPPTHLLALEAVLQQELGQQPGDGTRLLAAIVRHDGRTATSSLQTLQQRARSLAGEFGRHALLQAPARSFAKLLTVDTAVWQRALAVWELLGVPDPASLASVNLQPLAADWLGTGTLAKLAALQQLLPWQPTAADAVQQCAIYVAGPSPKRLIGRLLFLQQEGLLPLLVADRRAALRDWRRQQRGLPANRRAEGEPQLVSLRETANLSDVKFCAMLETVAAGQPEQQNSGVSSSGGTAERFHAFMAQLPRLPAYQRLLAAGEAEAQRLAALLPPELVAAGKARQRRQRGRRQAVP